MPARYDPSSGLYRISCNTCHRSHYLDGPGSHASFVGGGEAGLRANSVYAFVPSTGAYRARCRACNAAARRATPRISTVGPRVPGTTRRPLGLTRRYGVEIEVIATCGIQGVRDALVAAGLTGWQAKYDGSLSGSGVEVVSPPLSGEEGLAQIRRVTEILRGLGCSVNRSCGLHVHHEIRDLRIADVKTAYRAWFASQDLIHGLVSPSRRGGNQYCRTLTTSDVSTVDSVRDLRGLNSLRIGRYKTLNLASYGRYGTVEIRQHQGTLDAEKIVSWVHFGQAMLDTALVAETAPAPRSMRDLLVGYLGERLNETARTFLLGRTVEFGAVAV